MWILWNILVGIMIAGVVTLVKKYGNTPINSYLIYMFGISVTTAWALPYAYKISPNFIFPCLIQNASVNIAAVFFCKVVFHDVISIQNWIGIVIITLGCFLLVR